MNSAKQWLAAHRRAVVGCGAVAAALALGLLLWQRLGGAQAQPAAAEEKVYTVRVIETSPTGNDVSVKYTGLVQPSETLQCTAATVGTIQAIYVREGDTVAEGQVIAQLDDSDARRQLDNLAAVLKTAQNSLDTAVKARDRAQKDYDEASEGAPSGDLDTARAQRDAARADRDQKQAEAARISGLLAPQQQAVKDAQAAYDAAVAAQNAAQSRAEDATAANQAAQDALQALADAGKGAGDPEYDAAATAAGQAAADEAQADAALESAQNDARAKRAALAQQQADLATQQASLGQAAAESALAAAEAQLNTKQAAYDALKNQGEDSSLAKAQRERLDAANTAVDQAQTAYDTARMNYEAAQKAVEECTLKAGAGGYVVKVVGTEGGLATPLAPVAVLASHEAVVQFGASQSDVRELRPGMDALVTLEGQTYYGHISSIALLPDEDTRTYPVSVDIGQGEGLFLGSMATVQLALGQRIGVWLPLAVILNDGQDYVYIVQNGRALRRDVEISEVSNDMVLVTGLDEGCQVISEGMKTVRSGSAVQVAGQSGGEVE